MKFQISERLPTMPGILQPVSDSGFMPLLVAATEHALALRVSR